MLALLTIALAACGTAKAMPNFNTFQHRVTDGTVALFWNCSRPEPGVVRVEGVANNPYYPTPIEGLEFLLYGVTAQGASISPARASAQAYWIETNAPPAFTIDLKNQGSEVRYDLVYSYRFSGRTRGQEQNMAQNICAGLEP